MKLPGTLLSSLKNTIGFDQQAFEKVHAGNEQVISIRVNPAKAPAAGMIFSDQHLADPVPWSRFGYYLRERPSFTFDPLFHAGCYYVQEASSMFIEQALVQTLDLARPNRVLDLSAAPGGKSTHIQSLLNKESLLVSNEVIRSRANTLRDNLIKWGCANVVVTNNDPKEFQKLSDYFDVLLVDAPCSGSGLFRRDPRAIEEWSPANVALCSQRQRRILADAYASLKNGGVLIYSTCSYSGEEDEEILDWISESLDARTCRLELSADWGIVETSSKRNNYGYRFWPYHVKGEGFFVGCFRKDDGAPPRDHKFTKKASALPKQDLEAVKKWVNAPGFRFVTNANTIFGWPEHLFDEMNFLLANCRVTYAGVRLGERVHSKLIPDHALAMSGLISDRVARVELDRDHAIAYLQRKELSMSGAEKGWQLVTYRNLALGWINVLAKRVNNYYPKELRILKETI